MSQRDPNQRPAGAPPVSSRVRIQSGPLPHEVVLVDISLGSGIRLEAADRHTTIMNGSAEVVVARSLLHLSLVLTPSKPSSSPPWTKFSPGNCR